MPNRPQQAQVPTVRTAGGLHVPAGAAEVVPVQTRPYVIGGMSIEAPEDPGAQMMLDPSVLADPGKMLGLLTALILQNSALARELERVRDHLGLPTWNEGERMPGAAPAAGTAPAESAPEETPQ